MRNGIKRHPLSMALVFVLLVFLLLLTFLFFLRFELNIDQTLIKVFFVKYFWIVLLALITSILLGNMLISKILRPFLDISKTTKKILERSASSNLLHSIKNLDDIPLAGAIDQLAENIEMQLEIIGQYEVRLHGVLENMSNGLLLVAKDRRIVLVSKEIEELLGYSADDLVGKRHVEGTRHSEMSEIIEECFQSKEKLKRELKLYYPKDRIIQANFTPMKNEFDEVIGVVAIFNDITDIKKLEEIRRDFVTNVSHELKTPLTSIKGFTETLIDGAFEDKETALHFLNIISTESDRVLTIVNDLLDLSKIESNKISLNKESFYLRKLVELLVTTLETQIANHEVELSMEIEDDLLVKADKSRLSQILINLMNNAISYTQKRGLIKVGAISLDKYIMIFVQDNGVGISKQNLHRVFERFYRVDKARTRQSGGTGLGLAIVKHLVEAHDGKIEVESEIGKGTTFKIYLPK